MLILTKDRILATVLIIGVSIMWVASGDIRPPTNWQPYGSALFPRILLVVIGCLSLVLLVRSLLAKSPARPPLWQCIKEWLIKRSSIVALFALFGLYAALLPLLGYIVATAAFLVSSLMLLLGIDTPRKWAINISISIPITLLIFVIFRYGLKLWLP